ncbi:MAG: chorismate synthase [Treponema sp.]|jgi:chorismate synthase|nr:chorismate synthase [Treponema sp.]
MSGSSFGEIFRVVTFGESHGPAVGCVIDGCPAGLRLEAEDIARDLRRRRPGGGGPATSRTEPDEPEILSGIFEGKTLGTPIAVLIRNTNHRSSDYDNLKDLYRPGHADWTWEAKYGVRDYRGGGRSSGRETAGRVAAGAVAKAFLAEQGITLRTWTSSAAGIAVPRPAYENIDWEEAERNSLCMPHRESAERALAKLEELRQQGDSAGCAIGCSALGLPPGLGEPVFGKLNARIAAAMLSLGAAKGVEFGLGFAAATGGGAALNDRPVPAPAETAWIKDLPPDVPALVWRTNNAGGTLGGISTGMPLNFTVAFKPISSVFEQQQTVDRGGKTREFSVGGRHDICAAPRAVPVVEAMAALVLADLLLLRRCARL